jgi:hypothetical protein
MGRPVICVTPNIGRHLVAELSFGDHFITPSYSNGDGCNGAVLQGAGALFPRRGIVRAGGAPPPRQLDGVKLSHKLVGKPFFGIDRETSNHHPNKSNHHLT